MEHYLAVGVLPVDEAGPAVVDGGVGGGGYVYGDVVIFGSGDEAEEGEEKRERDGEEHCEVGCVWNWTAWESNGGLECCWLRSPGIYIYSHIAASHFAASDFATQPREFNLRVTRTPRVYPSYTTISPSHEDVL